MALLQDALVTAIAIGAGAALVRRLFVLRRPAAAATAHKPGCPGCASACDSHLPIDHRSTDRPI